MLLEQLHRHPAGGGPQSPRSVGAHGSSGSHTNAASSSSSNNTSNKNTRDVMLQLMVDEIMPQFLADTSVQQLASLLQQQQTSKDLTQVGLLSFPQCS